MSIDIQKIRYETQSMEGSVIRMEGNAKSGLYPY
jgi:hypothetical protein